MAASKAELKAGKSADHLVTQSAESKVKMRVASRDVRMADPQAVPKAAKLVASKAELSVAVKAD